MRAEFLKYLCCPACKGRLDLKIAERKGFQGLAGQLLCEECSKRYEVNDGLPNLVHPEVEELPQIDAQFLKQYERMASSYDRRIRFTLLLLGIWEPQASRILCSNVLYYRDHDLCCVTMEHAV